MAFQEHYEMTRDNLFAATQLMPVVPDSLMVAKAGLLKRGTLLDANGAVVASNAEVYAVLAEDVDTTDAAQSAPVYLTGEFNENALIVAEGAAVADFKASARKVCIFFKPSI